MKSLPKRKENFYITKISYLVQFKEITAVYSKKIYEIRKYTLWAKYRVTRF